LLHGAPFIFTKSKYFPLSHSTNQRMKAKILTEASNALILPNLLFPLSAFFVFFF